MTENNINISHKCTNIKCDSPFEDDNDYMICKRCSDIYCFGCYSDNIINKCHSCKKHYCIKCVYPFNKKFINKYICTQCVLSIYKMCFINYKPCSYMFFRGESKGLICGYPIDDNSDSDFCKGCISRSEISKLDKDLNINKIQKIPETNRISGIGETPYINAVIYKYLVSDTSNDFCIDINHGFVLKCNNKNDRVYIIGIDPNNDGNMRNLNNDEKIIAYGMDLEVRHNESIIECEMDLEVRYNEFI